MFARIYNVPKIPIVLPDWEKIPQAPTFLFDNEFWIAEMRRPAEPVTIVPVMAAFTASFG